MGNGCSQECAACAASRDAAEVGVDVLPQDQVLPLPEPAAVRLPTEDPGHGGLPRLRLGSQGVCVDQCELPKSSKCVPAPFSLPLVPAPAIVASPDVSASSEADVGSMPFVEVVFDADGQEKIIHFYKRPLGADFTKRPFGPTNVSKVNPQSYAWELGLKEGWAITAVDGDDMSKKTFEETQAAMFRSIAKLPQSDA